MSSQRQRNWDREQDKVYQIPYLIPMNAKDHAALTPLDAVVSYNESDDYSIVAPQVSEGEPLSNYGPPDSPITPEPLTQHSS